MPVRIENMPIYIFLVSSLLVRFVSYTPYLVHCPTRLPTFCTQLFALNLMYPMQLCCLSLICHFDNLLWIHCFQEKHWGLPGLEAYLEAENSLFQTMKIPMQTLYAAVADFVSVLFSRLL